MFYACPPPPPLFPVISCSSLSLYLQNGLTALDVAAANTKGDSEAVCELLRMYMEESAPLETHHVRDCFTV